ncbi:TRAP transporter small permease subunit [Pelomicrobium methylotrophicum]|uniref:TRAP transporter small permease protein n=1 Tax=Pelomicrobium methylotrophicum TaxID=2602750 RepID=A0A5C7EEX2_9PROT|nr:TRAP transporter small permease subunit [Pelomicrobium methylotrophicum]TXF10723.1 TRAP transporter small permease subunit [Pelomicrobium methylotrophicum]
MGPWLRLARLIDTLNERVGRTVYWLVLVTALLSAFTALIRYALHASSNAALELQWYLYALIFLLAAGYTLKHDGHVRIDVLFARLTPRAQAWIDLVGGLIMLLPMALIMVWLSWHSFALSFATREMSPDAGGLARWPIKLAIPVGFALLALQGIAEIIKRAAFLRGKIPDPRRTGPEIDQPAHLPGEVV